MDYTIFESNKLLRAYTRKQLAGKWLVCAGVTFVYMLIYAAANILMTQISAFIETGSTVQHNIFLVSFIPIAISSAIIGPIAAGYLWYFLYIARGEPASLHNIFDGFRIFSKSFALILLQNIFIMLWCLLLLVPGIIKSCSYAMTLFILRDNPDITASEVITQSRRMMNGHKMRYFLLQLSFMGWFALCILSGGIGLLWLMPYISLTNANFYEYIKNK